MGDLVPSTRLSGGIWDGTVSSSINIAGDFLHDGFDVGVGRRNLRRRTRVVYTALYAPARGCQSR